MSIHDKSTPQDQLMTAMSMERKGVVYPMVTAGVNGLK